jgi:electron-transferring-flavoprotein dehydrogenase
VTVLTRKPTASASRNCGKSSLISTSSAWSFTAAAGRCTDTYGGGFLYHLENNQIAVGFVVGLGYSNPHLSPYEEFQRFKTHPEIRKFLEGGKRIAYGARALTAGGLQSLPKLTFPGGVLIGDDAGFLNAARIKGSHCAIKTGSLAAEACFEALASERQRDELIAYPELFKNSWLYDELHKSRNFKPWMNKGLMLGSIMFGIDQVVLRGKAPWTLHNRSLITQNSNRLRRANRSLIRNRMG